MSEKRSNIDLRTISSRRKLPPDHNPYFTPVRKGLHLGFRRAPDTGVETWLGRARIEGKYHHTALGGVTTEFDHATAVEALLTWEKKTGEQPSEDKSTRGVMGWTVSQLLATYIDEHENSKGKAGPEWRNQLEIRASRVLHKRPHGQTQRRRNDKELPPMRKIATIKLRDLTAGHILELQQELQGEMKSSSVNRTCTSLRAAINWAWKKHNLQGNPLDGASRVTEGKPVARRKFPMDECVEVVRGSPDDLLPILTCLLYTGARPVGARRLRVGDVELDRGRVWFTSRKGKNHEEARYYTSLSNEAVEFLRNQIGEKRTDEFVFVTASGKPWTERNLSKAFDRYRATKGLTRWDSLYCFRHSAITFAIKQGMPAPQAAAEYGTSLQYIQENYFERDDDLARSFSPSLRRAS
jgi:integrase